MTEGKFDLLFKAVTLLISLVALGISLQSNRIARQANESAFPQVEVVEPEYNQIMLWATSCVSDIAGHGVTRTAGDDITIINNGGRSTALLKVEFFDGDISYESYEYYTKEQEEIETPILVEPGEARVVRVIGREHSWKQKEVIKAEIDSLNISPKEAYWSLYFSDGSVLTHLYPERFFSIETTFTLDC